jgi:capsular exopolysaccharide synthesis family protein
LAAVDPPPVPRGVYEDEGHQTDAIAQLVRVAAILRRRWLVVVATTVLCVTAAAMAINMLQPRWRASASIVLHTSGPQVFDKVKGVSEDAEGRVSGYPEYYQTQRMIMRSRAVAQRALEHLGLASDPTFLGIDTIEDPAERAAAGERVDPVERLQNMVSVEEIRNSRVVKISAEYPDALVARDIANAVADAYVEHVSQGRSRLGEEAKENIVNERDKALAQVRSAEKALEDFKKANAITSISLSDRQNVITQDMMILSQRTKEAEADRIKLENMLAQAELLHEKGDLAAASLLPEHKRAVFEEMRRQRLEAATEYQSADVEFGPKHEEHRKAKSKLDVVNASIEGEAQALISALKSQLAAAKQTEADLERSLGRENGRALTLGSLERGYRELEREARAAEADYLLVARRDTEIAITNRVEEQGIEILDRATVSNEQVFPRQSLFFALALVGGLGLGSILALSIDFRDQRIRGLIDLERSLAGFGVPVLGQLPLLPADNRLGMGNARAQRRQRDLYAHVFPQSLMAERCRGIRTSIAFVRGSTPAKTIMVTSPSSSEGKSSTAMNLALSFSQAKKKVVLVDADMRRPRIHQIFDTPPEGESAGLSALLSGAAELEAVLVRAPSDAPENLYLIPCGPIPDNPAELLEAPALRRTLAGLRERFDVVLIDSPPVLPVTDPLILAGQVDGVVVVTRCQQTTRGELQRALSQLRQGDANLLGVVLNEVDARQERYDYGNGYYYRAQDTGTDIS